MSLLEAIILGIIQGLTEFLPVSSSGHLELAKAIMGDGAGNTGGLLFTILVHGATAISTLVIFRKDVAEIIRGLFQFKWNEELKFSLKIVLSMIPAALVGLFLEDEIDAFFGGRVMLIGCMLILTGLLLFMADKAKNTTRDVSFPRALIVGIAQAIAILPGISRSGSTIATSVLLGIDRTRAARFSFLMVVPLILGAMTVKTKEYVEIVQFEKMEVQQRAEAIVAEAHEQFGLTKDQQSRLLSVSAEKELAWNQIKDSGSYNDTHFALVDIELKYNDAVRELKLDPAQEERILEDSVMGIRPINKPGVLPLSLGFLAAFLTGLLACQWMIQLVKKSKLAYFSYYCFAVGLVAIIVHFV